MTSIPLSADLLWRGMIKDRTFDDLTWLDNPKTFYLGTDPSSDSLTIGNLAVYMLARRLATYGWKAILLVGGATSLIGDPGGKVQERQLKSYEELAKNAEGIKVQVERLLAGNNLEVVNNYSWFKDIGYVEFLREVGKYYSMTELLQRDFVSARLGEGGSGISYAEFSYSLVQGYDYWWLFKNKGVELQIGGSDQWGNMLSGAPLVRKKEGKEVHCLSMPLIINKASGKKFGKSEEGAVWLDSNKTSIYQFFQFWLNVEDDDASDYLKIYTELDRDAIERTLRDFNQNRSGRLAQKTLAYEVTKIVHGQPAADTAKRVTAVLFGSTPYQALQATDFELLTGELPTADTTIGEDLVPALVKTGLADSNAAARRFMQEGGVYLNGQAVSADRRIADQDKVNGSYAILRRGKNNNAILRIVG